ncbi:MAG: ankyrin repeat domain-containing protein [Gammaproteobacteria bacterium]|nr:ankyrin repeat domain-containing protein [Gammaproteobacteria bacterium]
MKGKLSVKKSNGASLDQTALLSLPLEELQKRKQYQAGQHEIDEFIFVDIKEDQQHSVINILTAYCENHPLKTIQFKNCELSENLESQLVDIILSGEYKIKSIISSDNNQNSKLIKALLTKLTIGNTINVTISIGGLSLSISKVNASDYSSESRIKCTLEFKDFSSWITHKEELELLIEHHKSFNVVSCWFASLSSTQENEFFNWLTLIFTNTTIDVSVQNKKVIEEKLKKLNERNTYCRINKENNYFSFSQKVGYGEKSPPFYLLDESDIRYLSKVFSRNAETTSVSFSYCDTDFKNWANILKTVNQLKNLTSLNFSHIKLGVDRARAFAEELRKCTKLTQFSLSHIDLPPGGILTIIQPMCAIESLSEVEFGNMTFTIGDIEAVSKLPKLKVLKLPRSTLSDDILNEFEHFFDHPCIEKIDLNNTLFKAENLFQRISASSSFPTSRFIFYVDYNSSSLSYQERSGREDIQQLLNAINKRNHLMRKLKISEEVIPILNFNSLQFSDICIPIVCDYVQAHPEVEQLLLQRNILTVNGFTKLTKGLLTETKLSRIDLSHSKEKPNYDDLEKLLISLEDLSDLFLIGTQVDCEKLFERLMQSDAFPSAKVTLIEAPAQQPQTQPWGEHYPDYSRQEETKQAKKETELRAFQYKFDCLRMRNQLMLRIIQEGQSDEDPPLAPLKELNFDGLYLNDICLPILCNYIEHRSDLKRLSATNNFLTPVGVRSLCDTLARATHVVSVNFSGTRDSKEWLDYLVDGCIKFPHITHLVLYDTNPTKDQIIRCISQSKVEKLEVSSVHGLFEWFRDSTDLFTTEIITRNYEKDPEFVRVRNRNIKLRQLLELKMLSETKLDLSEAAITPQLVPVICEALNRNPPVRDLSLAGNNLDDKSMALFLNEIAKHSNIRYLDVTKNRLGDDSAGELAKYLKSSTILHCLIMRSVDITNSGVIQLADALKENSSLLALDVSHNIAAQSSLKQFAIALRHNGTLSKFVCLDGQFPEDPGVHKTKTDFGKGQQATAPFAEHKTKVSEYKKYIAKCRASIVDFHNILSAPKKKKNALDSPNVTLIECELFHSEVFSRSIGEKNVAVSPLPDYLKSNKTYGLQCTICICAILKTNDESSIASSINALETHLNAGVSPYFANEHGVTLVHLAASTTDKIVGMLLQRNPKFDTGILNDQNKSPLDIAEANGNQKVVEKLKDPKSSGIPTESAAKQPAPKKAKPNPPIAAESTNAKLAEDGGSSLPSLSTIGAPSPAKKAKVDDDPAADGQLTMKLDDWQIIQAISSENIMGLNFCINQNAALMTALIHGQTLLQSAVAFKKPRVVELLLEKGAIVNALNQEGRPALFCLLDECLKSRECSLGCLLIAKLLLENAAAIMDQGDHALHLAVRAGIVRLVKLLLRFKGDVNAKNESNNHTALTWAVLSRNLEILQILLLSPDLDKGTVELALQCAEAWKSSSVLIELLKRRLTSPFLDRKQNTHWLKDMKICFGASSAHNTLFIESHEQQMRLMLQNKFSSSILRSRKKIKLDEENLEKEEEGNPVTVSFTFIVSTRKHLSQSHNVRDCITITLDPDVSLSAEHHITKGDAEQTFNTDEIRQSVQARTKRGEELSKKDISERKHKPSEEIVDETRLEKRSFEALFHHGEQSLAAALEQKQVLDYLIRQLIAHPQFTTGCKLYGVVLDIHSPRYVCSNCEIGILSIQHPASSPFLNNLAEGLKQLGCILPLLSPLRMVTRIGSYQAFERDTITPEEQLNICLDLRLLGNKIILQQDLVVSANPTMQFNSRVNE